MQPVAITLYFCDEPVSQMSHVLEWSEVCLSHIPWCDSWQSTLRFQKVGARALGEEMATRKRLEQIGARLVLCPGALTTQFVRLVMVSLLITDQCSNPYLQLRSRCSWVAGHCRSCSTATLADRLGGGLFRTHVAWHLGGKLRDGYHEASLYHHEALWHLWP